jgi:hypothetical protein
MIVFISANQHGNNYMANLVAACSLQHWLVDHSYETKEVVGVYKGEQEVSFKVHCEISDIEEMVLLMIDYGQECILVMEDNGCDAHLLYPDFTHEMIGSMSEVTKEEALKADAYTMEDDKYYMCQ